MTTNRPATARPKPAADEPQTMRELRLARGRRRNMRSRARANPLREGLRLERVPDPCDRRALRGDRRPGPPQGPARADPALADPACCPTSS